MNREQIVKGIDDFKVRQLTLAKIAKAGLFIPQKPVDAVEGIDLFSEWEVLKKRHGGVANIPNQLLGDYLDRWTAMIAYTRWVEAVADMDQATTREIRDTIKKQLYTIQEGGRELRDALVATESIYIEQEQQFTENYALYVMVRALREGYEQRANAISREITRRGNDFGDSRRAINRGQGV